MPRFSAAALRTARLRTPPGVQLVRSGPGQPWRLIPPDGDWRRPRIVSDDLAALVAELRQPRQLPPHTIGARNLAGLILDGTLQIKIGGRYRSGGRVHSEFFPGKPRPAPRGRLGLLSLGILANVAASGSNSTPAELAARLYHANRRPISANWRRKLPDANAIARWQGIDTPIGDGIEHYTSGPWSAWDSDQPLPDAAAPIWKLYLSPTPPGTSDCCAALLALLGTTSGPFSMKVGRDLSGVLRADRLVGYFATQQQLQATARMLRRQLGRMPAQGVPFSAGFGSDGLLSWGADLPVADGLPRLGNERSWRGWIAVRLGTALWTALGSGAIDPVSCALDRLSLDGVDTNRWRPDSSLLKTAPATSVINVDP